MKNMKPIAPHHGFAKTAMLWLLAWVSAGCVLLYKAVPKEAEDTGNRIAARPFECAAATPRPRTRSIEAINVGDYVLAKGPHDAGLPCPHRVVATPRNTTARLYCIQTGCNEGSGVIRSTGEHPFWVMGRGWTAARAVRAGDRLMGESGSAVPVVSIFQERRRVDTYNLTVEGAHTYYVVADGRSVLVHNLIVVTPSGQAIIVPPNAISMDDAISQAVQHAGPDATMGVSGSGSYQFVGKAATDPVTGDTLRNIGRLDVNLSSGHVQRQGGPHLNLEVQRNGDPVPGDPHTPIDQTTIRPGDCP